MAAVDCLCDTAVVIGEFETGRLRARPITAADASFIAELNSDDEVMRHLTGRAMTREESALEVESALGSRWLLFTSNDNFIGWVGAEPTAETGEFDIGWRLHRSAWSQGFASEAARELIDRLFAHGARRVVATTMAVNQRSRSVMDRIGMTYLRAFHLEFDDPLPGTEHGEVEYELTSEATNNHPHTPTFPSTSHHP